MLELLKNRYPFVTLPMEELNKEQQKIKKEYDRLREIRDNESGTRRKSK
jgi:hypothetical protein